MKRPIHELQRVADMVAVNCGKSAWVPFSVFDNVQPSDLAPYIPRRARFYPVDPCRCGCHAFTVRRRAGRACVNCGRRNAREYKRRKAARDRAS